MKTFTRVPWAYWGDRLTILVILCGTGVLFVAGTFQMVSQGQTGLGPLPVLGPLVGGAMILWGIWAYFRPWPTRIEIDAQEVRIFHRPTKTVALARKDVIGAKSRTIPKGGTAVGIVYRNAKGKTRTVKIYGGWVGDDGTRYVRLTVDKAINAALGIKP